MREADAVRFLLEKLDCGLSVELHYDYESYLSLLVFANWTSPSRCFLMYRSDGAINLVDVSGDDYRPAGIFPSFIGALTFIQRGSAAARYDQAPPLSLHAGEVRDGGAASAAACLQGH